MTPPTFRVSIDGETPRQYQTRWDTRRRAATMPETALRDLTAGCSLVIAVFTLIPFVLIVIGG